MSSSNRRRPSPTAAIPNSGGQSSANIHGRNYFILLSTPVPPARFTSQRCIKPECCRWRLGNRPFPPRGPRCGLLSYQWHRRGVRAAVATRTPLQHGAKNIEPTNKRRRGIVSSARRRLEGHQSRAPRIAMLRKPPFLSRREPSAGLSYDPLLGRCSSRVQGALRGDALSGGAKAECLRGLARGGRPTGDIGEQTYC